jgi:acetyl esterase/lipase
MSRRIPRLSATLASVLALGGLALAQPTSEAPATSKNEAPKRNGDLAKRKLAMPLLDGVEIERDLTYAKLKNDRSLKLDLYVPKDAPEKLPLIVWIHGGGWSKGSKTRAIAAPLSTKGYVVASVEYRLSGEAHFPAQIEDCKAAIRWLRANAKTYHIDPEKVGAWGASAGGHLVALIGTTGDKSAWDVGDHLDQSSRVQAVCDFFGPADFTKIPAQSAKADGPVSQLLGGSVSEKSDAAREASPISHISRDDPPFLICHGTEDRLVPLKQSVSFYEALTQGGVQATLVKVERGGHGFRGDTDPSPADVEKQVRAFFDEQLKSKP